MDTDAPWPDWFTSDVACGDVPIYRSVVEAHGDPWSRSYREMGPADITSAPAPTN